MTLYDILNGIENCFDPETGEIDTEAMEALELARDEKIENICLYVKNLLAEANAIRDEEKKLAERRKRSENKADRLKAYLQNCLAGDSYKSPRCVVSYRTSEAVEIDDLTAIPTDYLRYANPEPDKAKLKSALKLGEIIPGCHIEKRANMTIS